MYSYNDSSQSWPVDNKDTSNDTDPTVTNLWC